VSDVGCRVPELPLTPTLSPRAGRGRDPRSGRVRGSRRRIWPGLPRRTPKPDSRGARLSMAAKRKMPHGKAAHMLCQPLIARAYPATMDIMPFTLRLATVDDADEIAEVYSASFRLLTFLPMLHTVADNRSFVANVIFKNCEVIVAEDDSGIVSFLARQGEEVRLLYTRPDRIGRGAGTQLIEAAKKAGPRHWNSGAFRPTPAHVASTKRGASARSALPTVRTTGRRHPTSVTVGNLPSAAHRSLRFGKPHASRQ
jgi:GNAT superfamily N-acetyltransferase